MYLADKSADQLKEMARHLVRHGQCCNRNHSQAYAEIAEALKARSPIGGGAIPGNLTQAQINYQKQRAEWARQASEESANRQSCGLEAPDAI